MDYAQIIKYLAGNASEEEVNVLIDQTKSTLVSKEYQNQLEKLKANAEITIY